MKNNYYVYEWIRLDTNEPFYVGKGKGNRCYDLTRGRNRHFNNIVKSIPIAVNILHNDLDEEVSFGLEIYYIWFYRDIIGYDLCNITDGGEGKTSPCSEEQREKLSLVMSGENNPMFGKDWRKEKTEEELKKIHEKQLKNTLRGEAHPSYGIKRSDRTKRKIGKSIICLTTKRIFYTSQDGANYYNCDKSRICACCKGYVKRKGEKERIFSAGKLPDGTPLIWRKINWKHNRVYRILRR